MTVNRIHPRGDWFDASGKRWPLPIPTERLVFTRKAHAALRVHIYSRDNYSCQICGCRAAHVPDDYDGHRALHIEETTEKGNPIALVVDHIVSLANGGSTVPDNLRTLCATCNNDKARTVDRLAWKEVRHA